MTKKNMQIENEATLIEEKDATPRMQEITDLTRPRLMGIVSCYLLEENELGQIKENNLATHTNL